MFIFRARAILAFKAPWLSSLRICLPLWGGLLRAMPSLLRKIAIIAAVDGLILHAHGVNGPRHGNVTNNEAFSVQIDYKTKKISALPLSGSESLDSRNALEAYGLVGKLPSPVSSRILRKYLDAL